ncbi:MAG: hypothetical protein J6S21_02380, partial [Victivallales bacterium]|nr:hypothetical protein [Victivallales bacterium]
MKNSADEKRNLLVRRAILNGKRVDIEIIGGKFARIQDEIRDSAVTECVDARNMLAFTPFYNCHAHSSMVLLRGLADAADSISESVYKQVGTTSEILENAEKKIYALRKGERGDSLEHIGTTLHKVFDRLTELSQSDSAIPGLSTGMQDLDRKINGLNKSDLVLLAARPAMGKTAFALNLGLNVAKKYKKPVAIFSLEMSREQ